MLEIAGTIEAFKEDFPAKAGWSAQRQRTLKSSIGCKGVGLHSGAKVTMVLHPGAPDTGIVFRRTDIAGAGAVIPARWDRVTDTMMNTTIANDAGVSVRTIEHLMAAFAGMQIDNAVVDISGPELPVMDGSASPFLFLIECAGVTEQPAPRRAIKVLKRVVVRDGDRMASLSPSVGFSVHVAIDLGVPTIPPQDLEVGFGEGSFKAEISRARTYGFEQDVARLRAAGLAKGGSLDNAVVIGIDHRVLNEDGLRYEDEFVRHKALDAIGDLYLAGGPIIGRFHGVQCGHALNNRLLRELFADSTAWTYAAPDARVAAPPPSRLAAG